MAKELRRKVAEVFEVADAFVRGEHTFAYFDETLNEMDVEDAKQFARIILKAPR